MYTTSSLIDKIKKYTNIADTQELLDMLTDALAKLEAYEELTSDCNVTFDSPEELEEYIDNQGEENEAWRRAANFTDELVDYVDNDGVHIVGEIETPEELRLFMVSIQDRNEQ